jgi:hypothetical protein
MNAAPCIRQPALVAALILAPLAVRAQADTANTPFFTSHDAKLAAGFAIGTLAVMPFDRHWAERLQLPSNQDNRFYKRSATVFRRTADPGTLIVSGGLYLTGFVTKRARVEDLGLHSGEAILAASVAGFTLKALVGRALPGRPDFDSDQYRFAGGFRRDGKFQAFPSGHTLAAFAVASTITAEAQRDWAAHAEAVGLATYTAAALCGFSRMYNDAHWASDVVFGAGIGTLSGIAAVRYQHSHRDNWLDRTLLHASVAPAGHGRVAVGMNVDPD